MKLRSKRSLYIFDIMSYVGGKFENVKMVCRWLKWRHVYSSEEKPEVKVLIDASFRQVVKDWMMKLGAWNSSIYNKMDAQQKRKFYYKNRTKNQTYQRRKFTIKYGGINKTAIFQEDVHRISNTDYGIPSKWHNHSRETYKIYEHHAQIQWHLQDDYMHLDGDHITSFISMCKRIVATVQIESDHEIMV